MKLGKSQREREVTKVASVAAFNKEGKLLFGTRYDNGKYVLPGGCFNPGEEPTKAAVRELLEETGLTPQELEFIGEGEGKPGVHVWCFRALVDGIPTSQNDPDHEILDFFWVDPDNVSELLHNLHSPENVTLRLLGLQKPINKTEAVFVPTLIVVRHGQTEFNARGAEDDTERLRGWLDVPLNDTGIEQAKTVADELRAVKVAEFVVSDLQRARQTADIIKKLHPDTDAEITDGLRPWDMGNLNGKLITEVIPVMLDHIARDEDLIEGSSETFKQFQYRSLSCFKNLMSRALANPTAGAVVAVTHSRNTRILKGWLMAGAEDVQVINKKPLLDKQEVVQPGHFMVLEYINGHWVHRQDEDDSPLFSQSLQKAEDDDEISRLLDNPDVNERLLALKMEGITPKHLLKALGDENNLVKVTAAKHPIANKEVYDKLVRSNDYGIIKDILQYTPNKLDSEHLQALYDNVYHNKAVNYFDGQIKKLITQHPNLSQDLIRKIWKNDDVSTKKELIQHPEFPEDLLAKVGQDILDAGGNSNLEISYGKSAFGHSKMPPELLHRAVKGNVGEALRGAINNDNLPADAITDVLKTGHVPTSNDWMAAHRFRVLTHPNITPEHLDMALGDLSNEVRHAVFRTHQEKIPDASGVPGRGRYIDAYNPKLLPRHVERAIENRLRSIESSEYIFNQAVRSPVATPELLNKAFDAGDDSVKTVVANSERATPDILDKAIKSDNHYVVQSAVQNPNITVDNLKTLFTRPIPTEGDGVWDAAIKDNAHTMTPELYELASQTANPSVINTITKQNNVPASVLDKFMAVSDGQTQLNIALNPNVTAEQLDKLSHSHHDDVRREIARNDKVLSHGTLARLINDDAVDVNAVALRNPRVTADLLQPLVDKPVKDERAYWANQQALARSPGLSDVQFRQLADKHMPIATTPGGPQNSAYRVLEAVTKNNKLPGDTVHHIATGVPGFAAFYGNIIDHPNVKSETLAHLAEHGSDPYTKKMAREKLTYHDPDLVHRENVNVKFGPKGTSIGKLRKVRDIILAHGVKEIRPKDLPPGNYDVGRLPNGNISADKIQQYIDAVPGMRFNVSHSKWTGAQRHNEQQSKVFQLNLSTDQIQKMKEAGVWNTFQSMHERTRNSGHPVTPTSIGWVRYTDTPKTPRGESPHTQAMKEWQGKLGAELQRVMPLTEHIRNKANAEDTEKINRWSEHVRDIADGDDAGKSHYPFIDWARKHVPDAFAGLEHPPLLNKRLHYERNRIVPLLGDEVKRVNSLPIDHPEKKQLLQWDKDWLDSTNNMADRDTKLPEKAKPMLEWMRSKVPSSFSGLDAPLPKLTRPRKPRGQADEREGTFIDEVQSDFGQSFVRQAQGQARQHAEQEADRQGLAGPARDAHVNQFMTDAANRAESMWPENHYKVISQILFGGRHSNEVLTEGFLQHLRDKNKAGSPVHIHSTETKAPISGLNADKPVPGHFNVTYEDVPKKLGMEPQTYGSLKTQDNPSIQGQRTWGDKLHKFQVELNTWLDNNGIELKKATNPEHFKSILKAIDNTGPSYVDHISQVNQHPAGHQHEVDAYNTHIKSPEAVSVPKKRMGVHGITKKVVYQIPETAVHSSAGAKFMIKPYHERVTKVVSRWMKYPIQGWAEMANQALYHAGNIGHLHQKVHVAEHNMGQHYEHEPALVVKLEPGFVPVADYGMGIHKEEPTRPARVSARKIALMDFLTNNLDRHGGNLLVNPETKDLLAIDHSRSFQYVNNFFHKASSKTEQKKVGNLEDNIGQYMQSAVESIDPFLPGGPNNNPKYNGVSRYDRQLEYIKHWEPIFDWWEKNSQNIKQAFEGQLKALKNQQVKDHLRRNFNARAEQLDQMAHFGIDNHGTDWYASFVPQYRPGERTDEELENERNRDYRETA